MSSTSPAEGAAAERRPNEESRETPRANWFLKDILLPLLISRLVLLLIGVVAIHVLKHTPPPGSWEIGFHGRAQRVEARVSTVYFPLLNMWSRWDGGWYCDIAQHGYQFRPGIPSNTAFFPVYPMLIRAAHLVARLRGVAGWALAGIIASNAALVAAAVYLFLLTRLEYGEAIARRAVLYLLVFPTTLFLSAIYAESTFLALIIGAFYHARKGGWWLAGFLGCAATLSRPPGIVIVVGLAAEYLMQCDFRWRKIRWNVLAIALLPLALAGYLAYLRYAQGAASAIVQAQYAWGLKPQPQWRTLASFFYDAPQIHGGTHSLVDLFFTLAFLAALVLVSLRMRASYAAYSVAALAFITVWGSLESVPRYVLGIFPAFMLLALFGRKEGFDRAYLTISSAVAGFFMAVFAVWGWVA